MSSLPQFLTLALLLHDKFLGRPHPREHPICCVPRQDYDLQSLSWVISLYFQLSYFVLTTLSHIPSFLSNLKNTRNKEQSSDHMGDALINGKDRRCQCWTHSLCNERWNGPEVKRHRGERRGKEHMNEEREGREMDCLGSPFSNWAYWWLICVY